MPIGVKAYPSLCEDRPGQEKVSSLGVTSGQTLEGVCGEPSGTEPTLGTYLSMNWSQPYVGKGKMKLGCGLWGSTSESHESDTPICRPGCYEEEGAGLW